MMSEVVRSDEEQDNNFEEVEIGGKKEHHMIEESDEANQDSSSSSSSSDDDDEAMNGDKETEGEDEEKGNQDEARVDDEEDDPEANWEAMVPEPEEGGPEAEKRLIKELDWERKKTAKNQTWYLIAAKWLQAWKEYVNYDDDSSDDEGDEEDAAAERVRPGPISNSGLLEPQSDYLRRECMEGRHYIIVPDEAWKLWWKWYAGGPPLPRKTVTTGWYNQQYVVEVRLLHLKFVKSSDKNTEVPASFSKTASVGDVKKKICKRLKLDPTNVRLWDWHARYVRS
jgi:hypothetical protein